MFQPNAAANSLINVVSKSGNYTLTSNDDVVTVDTSGGNVTITLPSAVGIRGKTYYIQKTSLDNNSVLIGTTSSQTIGICSRASGSIDLNAFADEIIVCSDNANWLILNKVETAIASSGATAGFSGRTSGDYLTTSNSLSLQAGIWRVKAFFYLAQGTGTGCALLKESGIFSADGGNSGSAPAALTAGTNVKKVVGSVALTSYSATVTPISLAAAGNGQNGYAGSAEVRLFISGGNQSIYAVPRIDFSTTGTASASVFLTAERIGYA